MSSGRAIRLGIVLLMAGPVGCAAVGPDAPRYEVLSSQPATGSLTADAILRATQRVSTWSIAGAPPNASGRIGSPIKATNEANTGAWTTGGTWC